MTDLDKLYKDGEDAWNYDQKILRIANDTLQNKNLQINYATVIAVINEANERIEDIKKEGKDTKWAETLRDELLTLRDNIYDRIVKLQ